MMRSSSLLFALAIAFAAANHSHESVDEALPETDGYADSVHPMHNAKAAVLAEEKMTALLSSGASPKDCINAAKSAIGSVIQEVINAQRVLNGLNDGSKCPTKDQDKIDAAVARVAREKEALRTAEANLANAQNAKVVGIYKDFGSCGSQFFKSAEWVKAKDRVTKKSNTVTRAKQALQDAQTGEASAKRQANDARTKCRCDVRTKTSAELKIAKQLTNERERTIQREEILICLIHARSIKSKKAANDAGDKCRKLKISAANKKKLDLHQTKLYKGVAETECQFLPAPKLTVNLGSANGSPAGSYTFMRVPVPKSWNTKNTPDFGMRTVVTCGEYGMQPLCDNPGYCKPNSYCNHCDSYNMGGGYGAISRADCKKRCKAGTLALYIGQNGHLGYPPSWNSGNRNFGGWSNIQSYFQKEKTCYFIYPKITYDHCRHGGSHAGWTPNAVTGMSFMCGMKNRI